MFYNGALLNFLTSKQATVSTSSTEAEYIAASEAVKEGLYFVNLISELTTVNLPVKTYIDNIGAGYQVPPDSRLGGQGDCGALQHPDQGQPR